MKRVGMLVLGLMLAVGTPAAAQQPLADSVGAAAARAGTVTAQPSGQQMTVTSGLPPRAIPPRTMAGHWPMFALFVATWIAIVGYLLISGRKVSRLAARLAALEEGR